MFIKGLDQIIQRNTRLCTVVNESIDGKNHKPLQPLDKLGLTGTDGVFLAHPPLHHLVELVTGYRAHSHQQRVSLGQREPAPTYKNNLDKCSNVVIKLVVWDN